MKDLKCGLTACKHNKGYSCCAKSITVDRAADCSAYDPVASKRTDFEAGADFVRANYSVDTEVSCSASCIFNRDGRCRSNGITVMSEGSSPAACLTFIKG